MTPDEARVLYERARAALWVFLGVMALGSAVGAVEQSWGWVGIVGACFFLYTLCQRYCQRFEATH